MSTGEPWYGVRLVYQHNRLSGHAYEERILIVRAKSAEAAIEMAEAISVQEYEDESTVRLEYAMTFNIFDCDGPCLPPGTEVFSLIRDSDLTPDEYLNRFHTTGAERSQDIAD